MNFDINSTSGVSDRDRRPRGGVTGISCALLIVTGVLVYTNILSAPFIFDDPTHIAEDKTIRTLWPLWQVMSGTNRPVMKLSLAVNYAIGELDVTGYHVVNIAIHILAALTLFGIVRQTLLTKPLRDRFGRSAPWLAFAVALLWLLHPLQTQAVTYTIQRSESLMGLFYLLTFYCVIRCAQGKHRYVWGIAAVAACALGMGTKEVMVTAPLVGLLYDRTFLSGSLAEAFRRRWGLYLGLAATWGVLFGLVRHGLFAEDSSAGFGLQAVGPVAYALTQPGVILHYLRLTVWPHPLCLDYGWLPAEAMTEIVPPTIVIVVLLLATAWALWRRSWLGFVGTWFFLILAPTSSIMPIADLAVEHRMYLSLASVSVLAVFAAHQVLTRTGAARHWIACVLLIAVAASFGWVTVRRNRDYLDAVSIWQKVVDVAPRHVGGRIGLGAALSSQGNFDKAINQYRQALRLKPDYAGAHFNLGIAFESKGMPGEAVSHYRQALRLEPDYADAHVNLGSVLRSQNRLDEAIGHYRKALEIEPNSAEAHYNLGNALAARGQMNEAIRHYRQALQINPTDANVLHNLGKALRSQGQLDEAIRLAEQAADLTGHQNPAILDILAAAYAAAGRFDNAVTTAQTAVTLASAAGDDELTDQIRKRLEHYRQQAP